MNFTSLKYFLVTAEELSITRAASKLYISQQALSSHILKLERELGVVLFDRYPNMRLTYAGRELADYAARIIDIERQVHRTVGDINNSLRGELRIGMSYTCGRAILPYILPEFKQNHPMIDLRLSEGNTDELEHSLQRGDLDIVIGFAPFTLEDVETVDLVDERIFLVVPDSLLNRYYGACYSAILSECRRDLDLELFRHMPFIMLKPGNRTRTLADEYMTQKGFVPNVIFETENIETAYELSRQGMGLTVYPELFYWCIPHIGDEEDHHVELFSIPTENVVGKLQIGWLKGRYRSRAEEDFAVLCKKVLVEKMNSHRLQEPA